MASRSLNDLSDAVQVLRSLVGDGIFAFVLAANDEGFRPDAALSDSDIDCVNDLTKLLMESVPSHPGDIHVQYQLVQWADKQRQLADLCSLRSAANTPVADNDWRAAVEHYALERYPFVLLAAGLADMSQHEVFRPLPRLPPSEADEHLTKVLCQQWDALRDLLGLPWSEVDQHELQLTNSGSPEVTLGIRDIPREVLRIGFLIQQLRCLDGPSGLAAGVLEAAEILKSSLGGQCVVPALVVYRGISLDDAGSIEVGSVRLLPWRDRWRKLLPRAVSPGRAGDSNGQAVGFGAVLDVPVTCNAMLRRRPQPPPAGVRSGFTGDVGNFHQRLDSMARDMTLAAFVAFDGFRANGATEIARLVLAPPGGQYDLSYRDGMGGWPDYEIADRTGLESWAGLVETLQQHDTTKTEIGLDRLVRAVLHRMDSADALIDTVICWENLLGDSRNELGFRVSAAFALLVASPSERQSVQKRVNELYGMRSKIVHGAKPKGDLFEASRDAFELTRRLLRTALDECPDILTGETKAKDIILYPERWAHR